MQNNSMRKEPKVITVVKYRDTNPNRTGTGVKVGTEQEVYEHVYEQEVARGKRTGRRHAFTDYIPKNEVDDLPVEHTLEDQVLLNKMKQEDHQEANQVTEVKPDNVNEEVEDPKEVALNDELDLESKSYRELQQLAKDLGLKASGSTKELIEKIQNGQS